MLVMRLESCILATRSAWFCWIHRALPFLDRIGRIDKFRARMARMVPPVWSLLDIPWLRMADPFALGGFIPSFDRTQWDGEWWRVAQWPIILQEWYEGDAYPDGYWESDPPGSPRGPGCSSTAPVLHCLVWPFGREFISQILDCRIRMQPFPRSRSAQLQARCWGNDGMDSRQVPHTRQERNLLNWSSYKGKQVSPTDVSTSFVTGIYRAPHMCLNCISAQWTWKKNCQDLSRYRKSNFSQTKQVKQAGAAGTTDITSFHEAYFQV